MANANRFHDQVMYPWIGIDIEMIDTGRLFTPRQFTDIDIDHFRFLGLSVDVGASKNTGPGRRGIRLV